MRLLCLHGGGGNAKVMQYQTRLLRAALGETATFEFLEGERPWPAHLQSPTLLRMFGEGPYYGWYGVSDDDMVAGRDHVEKLKDPHVRFTYDGVDAALARVRAAIASRGPFDALLAFSQGAIVTTLLTALALEEQRTSGLPGPSWRRNVLVCGIPPRDDRYMQLFKPPAAPLDFPATLVHGLKDEYYEYGQRLGVTYPRATVLEHEDGHKFPGSKEFTASLAAHLREVLAADGSAVSAPPQLTQEQVATIQEQCFADDVPVPAAAFAENWNEARLRSYFESGGGGGLCP